ncbi:MAG: hypothetical protein ACOVJ5_00520 [Gloeomargaritales cyanobacterium]
MALTRLDLSAQICVEDSCNKLLFSDTTGSVGAACAADVNEFGYGLFGGITSGEVQSAVINVYYPLMTSPVKFTFVMSSNVILFCIINDLNGVATNITSLLTSTVFPLVDFDISADYGVTVPEVTDGLYTWDYTITGISPEEFTYTTSGGFTSDCTVDCCIEKSYLQMDSNCGCFDDKVKTIIRSEVFLWASRYAINVGQDSKADNFLTKAKENCETNCKDC